jgi:type II secretory pathway component PulK
MVLVAVLVVTALAALVAAALMYRARAEMAASTAFVRGEQATTAALSGLHYTMAVLKAHHGDIEIWYDNPDLFQSRAVAQHGDDTWYFTIYAADPEDEERVRYGAVDEGGKMDVNMVSEEMLAGLERLPDDLLDCLLDYRDGDSDARAGGAEQEYYDRLPHPYVIPNGPLSTIEELLLVKGFTGDLVYGEDANLNGRLDPNEDDGLDHLPRDDRDGRLDPGLRDLLTVYSSVPNLDSDGRRRININQAPLPDDLAISEDTRELIGIYLAEGKRFTHPAEVAGLRFQVTKRHEDFQDVQPGTWIEENLAPDDLAVLLDRTTADTKRRLTGLINVNTASADVLATLPGLDAGLARQIVDIRSGLSAETRSTIAWLYEQGVLEADRFKEVAPRLTARSYQFSVRCVGFGVPCGQYRVLEAVVDLAGRTPRLAYVRDVTRLGLPFALDPERLERSL